MDGPTGSEGACDDGVDSGALNDVEEEELSVALLEEKEKPKVEVVLAAAGGSDVGSFGVKPLPLLREGVD